MDIGALDSLRIVLDPVGQAGVALALVLLVISVNSVFPRLSAAALLVIGALAGP